MQDALYPELNKAWKSACRVLFGGEIGELKDFEEWLKEYPTEVKKRKSSLSGKEVFLSTDVYCKTARFVSADERKISQEALTINEIKDIDSIQRTISEKWEYVGNRILGLSTNVESSDFVVDSHYVFGSSNIQKSSYVFRSSLVASGSKYVFGSCLVDETEFTVRCTGHFTSRRCIDSHYIGDCSDIFFSYDCGGSHDLLFSFGQRNKRNMIGNLPLPKEKYFELKKKLLGEIAEELRREKKFPSILTLVPNKEPRRDIKLTAQPIKEGNIEPIEKAFSSTCKVLLKQELKGIDAYRDWLSRNIVTTRAVKSAFGPMTIIPEGYDFQKYYSLFPEKRMVTDYEEWELGGLLHLSEADITSLKRIGERLSDIGFFTAEYIWGVNNNIVKSPAVYSSSDVYNSFDTLNSQYIGISSSTVNSKYIFGSRRMYDSQFCIDCYDSHILNRCFEVDASTKCADTYFAHNCEGLSEAMFCWNTKGKRYAIGNAQLPPEQYRKVKDVLISQMADEIVKNKELKWDIFNIGCYKK